MKSIFKNWDLVRTIRLILGIIGVVAAISINDYFLMALGGIFILQAILNLSCCSAGCGSSNTGSRQIYKDVVKEYDFNNKNNNK